MNTSIVEFVRSATDKVLMSQGFMNESLIELMLLGAKFVLASLFLVLVYVVFFRERAGYNHNRVFLLSVIGVSLLFTFSSFYTVNLTVPTQFKAMHTESPIVQVSSSYSPTNTLPVEVRADPVPLAVLPVSFTALEVVVFVYIFVTVALLLVLGVQLLRIMNLKRRSVFVQHSGFDIYQSEKVRSGFSFYKFIFLSNSLSDGKYAIILQHEKWHIRHRHYIDMILIELLCRLFWFNPLAWWVRKELRSVGEFQVDKSVLSEGQDIYTYQTMILEDVISMNPYLAHGFNQSFTKKRFIKMKKSMPVFNLALNRTLLVVTFVLGFALFSFSFSYEGVSVDQSDVDPVVAQSDVDPVVAQADELESMQLVNESILKIEAYLAAGKTDSTSKVKLLRDMNFSEIQFNGVTLENIPLSQAFLEGITPKLLLHTITDLKNVRALILPLRNGDLSNDSLNKLIVEGYMSTPMAQKTIEYVLVTTVGTQFSGLMGMFQSMLDSQDGRIGSGRIGSGVNGTALDGAGLDSSVPIDTIRIKDIFQSMLTTQVDEKEVAAAEAAKKSQSDRDGDIWSKAYRVKPEQIVLSDQPYSQNSQIVSIDVNTRKKETYITITVPIGDDQWWIRFDKLIEIVDKATKDRYLVRRIERGLPLSKTMIVSGHGREMIEITLVFPLLKASVSTIDFMERTSHDADLMSNNSGNLVFRNVSIADYPVNKATPSVFQ